jgi:hypothetical protein
VLALAAASGFLTVGVIALVGGKLGGHAGEYGLLIGIAGAIAIAPVIATTIIDSAGVSTGFMLSGAALIVIGLVAALALHRTEGRDTVSSPAGGRIHANPLPPVTSPARTRP